MRVVTYWQELAPYPAKLMACWRDSWERAGFDTVVTGIDDAQRHPDYDRWRAWAHRVPTRNNRDFETASWLRWLAYEQFAPALFLDYDCINFGLRPADVPTADVVDLGAHAIYATASGIREFRAFWPMAQPVHILDQPTLSDMYAMQQFCVVRRCPSTLLCAESGRPEALSTPIVHFGNAWVQPEHRHHERWRAIEEFRQTRK